MSAHRVRGWLAALGVALAGAAVAMPSSAGAAELPPGFNDRIAFAGVDQPTSLAFSPDGRVYVAEKRGTVISYDGVSDTTPLAVADLRTQVNSFYERGLLSVALDPKFPSKPFVYVGYTYDAPIGGTAPTWGTANTDKDNCLPGDPDPSYESGCKVSSRVSRLTLGPDGTAIGETVLVEDWCQQFPSHSIGDLAFDRQGALLVGGGDGAYFGGADVGTRGDPAQACEDPAGEGGALRTQDLITSSDPVGLDGTIIRIDPATGAPLSTNPAATAGGNAARIVAYGLRNPFRFAMRPGTDDLFIADVGWATNEEIDVVDVAKSDTQQNFGWPCFEGTTRQSFYQAENASICNTLYAEENPFVEPWFTYRHDESVVKGDRCPDGGGTSAISGIDFERPSTGFPVPYDNALFFADYTRDCIWSMPPGKSGEPIQARTAAFESEAEGPIDLTAGPDGLFYPDLFGGAVRQISYDRPTVELKLKSKPKGVALGLGKRSDKTPVSVTLTKGSGHKVIAPERARVGKKQLVFSRWSDGGTARHRVSAKKKLSLTAYYSAAKK